MWYGMQVGVGKEEQICAYCEAVLRSKELGCCFVPHFETQMKLGGQWSNVQKLLFPGYVFFSTDDRNLLAETLCETLGLAEPMNCRRESELFPLSESDVQFLESICGSTYLMEMSVGAIEGNHLKILSGPLSVVDQSRIVKIDRHKRRATLAMDLFGCVRKVQVGLEVKTKTA